MSQNTSGDLDPFAPWKELRDASMETWAKSMAEAVNTEAFAQNLGAYLNTYLATSAPLQKFVEQYMETTLARLSMPSRDEVIDLARRMTSIETRLDDLDAKLDQVLRELHTAPPAPAPAFPDVEGRLRGIEERTERLLSAVESLAVAKSTPTAPSASTSATPVTPASAVKPTARGRGRAKGASNEESAKEQGDDV